jgi:DNA repair protein RecO (recombination protein O)
VLSVRPLNEADAVVVLLAEEHGVWRGLVRGGLSRRQAATWQPGNVVAARWVARLAEQLGTVSGELALPTAALALEDGLALAILQSACAMADVALPEREAHPRVFGGLVRLLAALGLGPDALEELVRWEALLLADLGYGLDLTCCAVTGERTGLGFVSPRTGRAVSTAAAGVWKERLLVLPAFLLGGSGGPEAWCQGLALTGHFLARDALGHVHRPLPAARVRLVQRVRALCDAADVAARHDAGVTQ